MKPLTEKIHSCDQMTIHTVPTDKYKTTSLIMMMKAPLEQETVALRALLPQVLQNGTASKPSRKELRQTLDEMYGALFTTDVQKKGEQHIITLRLEVANEQFLSDSTPLLKQATTLLAEILLHPRLEGDTFVNSVLETEKRSLIQRIESVYDDKMRYANVRVTEEMCKGERFALTAFGTAEEVQAITAESLHDYYVNAIRTNQFDLYLVGSFEEEQALADVREAFAPLIAINKPANQLVTTESPDVDEIRVVHEAQDVKQGKLHIGFRTYLTYSDEDYVAMQVCNGLFGGFSHSKLFINVREKESLAYYAASRLESHKGIMMVMSGIEFAKYERAVEIIKEQFAAMQQGDFSTDEVEQTKAMLKNQILETADVARGYVELLYHQVISGSKRALSEWLEQVDAVTKEDIVRVAKHVKLDTIYFLKGKE
ncbi:EF-P 5-aminopentanol modification-associated protein YfmF [Halalkalibacter oceani]|uniref:EF-P 5-aminopentanol modification-associated protein YfmF n=1 Tax=Halalkalibacter oceani TaxID=1653776 RepID=UPI00339A04B8